MQAKFAHDVTAVCFRRLHAEVQHHRNLFGALSLNQKLHDFPLTRRQHLFYELLCVGYGQNQNALQRIAAENLTRGFQSVQTRHANVENDDIRVQLPGLLDCLASVGSFTAYLPPSVRFEDGTQPPADDLMVISNQDAQRCHRSPPQAELCLPAERIGLRNVSMAREVLCARHCTSDLLQCDLLSPPAWLPRPAD